ncbi:hypothetical protein HCN44_008362 [Aphidius gifuensis]|uniref:Hexosyltransferase n=1 Tax=Aphidius gifuensis TaxID=684658 RepID=A0A835CQ08_APHGI|nr:beta-1,3-galactosyltransferase 5-like [Aphidius gifuensis]XP_044016772.1 beta-1,3-galactosyltransferase 5-like [Aphidius gifuensis]KAF7989688.1 hypothetical protein HCN44_008362 [Aphidius gifuensis]
MNHFFKLRSRVLQSLILGFICITFYTYYWTTDDQELRPYILGANISASALIQAPPIQNLSLETTLTVSNTKNTTIETVSTQQQQQLNNSHNINNALSQSGSTSYSTLITNTNVNITTATINNDTTIQQTKKSIIETTSTTTNIIIDEASARAIYQSGHYMNASTNCPNNGENMNLIIVVMSAPGNIEARTGIRQTWGHFGQRSDMSVVFIIGQTNNTKLEKIINNENALYGDIISGKFYDSYSNLTLKTISTLEWTNKYCSKAKFLLKTDDDMFINVPRLLSFIKKHDKIKNIIYGRLAKKWKPIRNKKSKYYVSQGQFKSQYFPDFTTGPAYLLSNDIINRLYEAALNQTYLKLEDVFTTGIVAQKIGIKRVHANEFLNKRISYSPCNVQHGISIHMVKYGEQFDLWKKLLDGKSKCN